MPHADTPPRWRALRLPKDGHTDAEYEDAWAADPATGRFVVADGASESAFSGLWARLLTEGFLAARRPRCLTDWLGDARQRWLTEVMGLELPWYAEIKREEGAFATLVGVGVGRGRWHAVAVGDSCLIRVRNQERVRAFPLRVFSDFDNQPALIGSRGTASLEPRYATGTLLPGDRLLLLTDALAEWFLRSYEHGSRPWDDLAPLLLADRPEEDFAAWAAERRGQGALRNDDVTVLSIEPAAAPEE
jgi:hypothetical protein